MPIIRRSDCVPLPIVVCPVVAVVILHTVYTSCHPTLQHHNSYNRTDNYRPWDAVGSPDDMHKDARNMLRYYWLPRNHYLLHLVDFSFTYLSLNILYCIFPWGSKWKFRYYLEGYQALRLKCSVRSVLCTGTGRSENTETAAWWKWPDRDPLGCLLFHSNYGCPVKGVIKAGYKTG